MNASVEQTILGIDPGTVYLGYGVIKSSGQKLTLVSLGTVDLSKFPSQQTKLKRIFERVSNLIEQHRPSCCAIEAPFYGKNVQSMLKLGRAQGVAITVAMLNEIPVIEYSPKKIKAAVTGNGNASKEQVAGMLQRLLSFHDLPRFRDATDGLAAAVCHHFQNRIHVPGKKIYKSWKEFVVANPDRV
ncbi:MAG TPA: crossover junction endodeoxyribonuclease RuvC [Chitinophagales bacterium]|nr:crossover junction endodeoxyribonuclease RuvC [Chitinophagales bacterium]